MNTGSTPLFEIRMLLSLQLSITMLAWEHQVKSDKYGINGQKSVTVSEIEMLA